MSDRHRAAVARSLGWAKESADRGDYAEALAWVRVLEAIGEQLPPTFLVQRHAWLTAMGARGLTS